MSLVNLKTILDKAYRGGYAVGAFNIINLDFLEAVIAAARRQSSPVILNIAEVHFPFIQIEHIMPAIRQVAAEESFDIAVNLDHGLTMEAVERAVACGFTSVMFDGSKLSLEENIARTRQVVDICHPHGISVEAELGAVGGDEGGGLMAEADPAMYTNPDDARRFVQETSIDALAVAIGNSHGKYKGVPKLDFEVLTAIRDAAAIPLVLHGGSGISEEGFKKSISLGISKINFFTGMASEALDATKSYLEEAGSRYNDYPLLLASVKERVSAVVEEQMKIFGSSGKA